MYEWKSEIRRPEVGIASNRESWCHGEQNINYVLIARQELEVSDVRSSIVFILLLNIYFGNDDSFITGFKS